MSENTNARDSDAPVAVSIDYFSDILCVWAYVAQVKVDELRRSFGDSVSIRSRYVPVFGNVRAKIDDRWEHRGGFEGYYGHVREVAKAFDHVTVHPEIGSRNVPSGSTSAHAFVMATELAADEGIVDPEPVDEFAGRTRAEELAWRLRLAYFAYLEDVSRLEVQSRIAAGLDLPVKAIRERLDDGGALARLSLDHELAASHQISGSPTFLINEGRQRLYGNVGYRVIEANVQELLRDNRDLASWC
jgi:predicted DsbA family dithiol-disulfide isomerase